MATLIKSSRGHFVHCNDNAFVYPYDISLASTISEEVVNESPYNVMPFPKSLEEIAPAILSEYNGNLDRIEQLGTYQNVVIQRIEYTGYKKIYGFLNDKLVFYSVYKLGEMTKFGLVISTQTHVSKTSDAPKGIAIHVYLNHIFERGIPAVSDDGLTADGLRFWKSLAKHMLSSGGYVYAMHIADRKGDRITDPGQMDKYMKRPLMDYRFVISTHPMDSRF